MPSPTSLKQWVMSCYLLHISEGKSDSEERADVLSVLPRRQRPGSICVLERILAIGSQVLTLELDCLGYWISLSFSFCLCKWG